MSWTLFWDMYSGGGRKEKFSKCFIEAPAREAQVVFYNRFGHLACNVTCDCCGPDYSISESDTLDDLSEFHRSRGYPKRLTLPLNDWLENVKDDEDILVIWADEISDEDKAGEIPAYGDCW